MDLTLSPPASQAVTTIRVGHTPDMDDAFMFYGIATGAVPLQGLQFEHVIEDIQTLNRRAFNAELEMTAVSAASYPSLSDAYWKPTWTSGWFWSTTSHGMP